MSTHVLTSGYRIWPRTKVADWFHILSDPTREDLEEMMKVGQKVTWPKAGHSRIYACHRSQAL